jgi:hypothetical protein
MNRYWKLKFKNEYGIKIKTVKLRDDYGCDKYYLIYKVFKNRLKYKCKELVVEKVFSYPEEIVEYMKGKNNE